MLKDLISNLKIMLALLAQVVTADQNGTGIDLQGYGSAVMVFTVGNSGDTLSGALKIELEMEESDDNSTFTDVANADLSASVTGTNVGTVAVIDAPSEDSLVISVAYKGSKRYIRPVVNVTGTHTNGTPISAVALLGNPQSAPTA